jgi:hypothetical protein
LAIKRPNLAFLKKFGRNKMIWSFGLFFDLEVKISFSNHFCNFSTEHTTFNDIVKLISKIWQNLFVNLAFIWDFFPFDNLAFLKLPEGKFSFFYFLRPGKPGIARNMIFFILLPCFAKNN